MNGLSNIFLINYISPRCDNFIGVYSVDTLFSAPIKQPCCLITNLSKSNMPGSHFVAMHISDRNKLLYFDSFGFPPPIWNKDLLIFLRPWLEARQFDIVTSHPIQHLNSLFCGWFTAAFCLTVGGDLKWTPSKFIKIFKMDNLKANDVIVTQLIKKLENKLFK